MTLYRFQYIKFLWILVLDPHYDPRSSKVLRSSVLNFIPKPVFFSIPITISKVFMDSGPQSSPISRSSPRPPKKSSTVLDSHYDPGSPKVIRSSILSFIPKTVFILILNTHNDFKIFYGSWSSILATVLDPPHDPPKLYGPRSSVLDPPDKLPERN